MSHLTCTWTEFEKWIDKNKIQTFKKTILDVGCRDNKGQAIFEILGMVWTGIDKKSLDTTKVFTMNMTKLDFNDEIFDFVINGYKKSKSFDETMKRFEKVEGRGRYKGKS